MAHGYADIAMRRYRAGPLNISIFKKLAGLWWAGEVVNHIWIYGSKVAEGSSAFQRRSCVILTPQDQNKIMLLCDTVHQTSLRESAVGADTGQPGSGWSPWEVWWTISHNNIVLLLDQWWPNSLTHSTLSSCCCSWPVEAPIKYQYDSFYPADNLARVEERLLNLITHLPEQKSMGLCKKNVTPVC